MGLFGEVKCGRCDRRYSAIRGRCPYCGARRRTGKRDRGGGRGQIIAGLVILAVIVIAVVVLIVMSLKDKNPSQTPKPTPTTSGPVTVTSTPKPTTTPAPTQTPIPTPTPSTAPTAKVTSVTLNREDFTLSFIGEQWQMEAAVVPANTGLKVKWTSLDTNVATIDENGLVTAVGGGTTTVVAEVGGVTAECIVRVSASAPAITPDPQGNTPRLSHTDVTLDAGTKESFRLTVEGTAATPVYYSDNYNVASVASNGEVTAVSEGVATIHVTVGDRVLQCIVRVIRR